MVIPDSGFGLLFTFFRPPCKCSCTAAC